MRVRLGFALPLAIAVMAHGASVRAAPTLDTLVSAVEPTGRPGDLRVELTFLNDAEAPVPFDPPERIPARLTIDGTVIVVTLERVPNTARVSPIAARSFARVHYAFALPANGSAPTTATLALNEAGGFAFALAPTVQTVTNAPAVAGRSLAPPDGDTGNAFLANISAYEPIYVVYGPGTSADALVQFSLKYQLFGRGGAIGGRQKLLSGLHFAYTQRLYWDIDGKSAPFRNVDYRPELFFLVRSRSVGGGLSLGGQAGIRHESNGRDGPASRSVNTVYLQPTASFNVGAYKLSVGPRAWAYFGSLSDNPDIDRYRGNFGLFAQIGRDDGIRVSTTSRLNFGNGRGAINVEASYPLNRLIARNLNLYLFGQAFAGYGENLLDYDRRATRLRVGLGIVR